MTTKKDKPASIQKEYRKVSQLKNWDKNPRNIKEKDFERLKTQIRDLKQYKPLLITDDGIVLGGNMRLRAYRDLGTEEVWVSVVDAPDEETKMRYALSDNDRAGYYDGDMLANLTGEYPDFNWEDYAVDLKEPQTLDDLIKSLTPVEEDDVPEISDEPARSEYGKVYQLGRHRLMCGDATKIEDVERLMDGQKADMVYCDPPYGMALDTDYSKIKGSAKSPNAKGYKWEKVIGDDVDFDPSAMIEFFAYAREQFWWGADYYFECLPRGGSLLVWQKRDKADAEMIGNDFEICWSKERHKKATFWKRWVGFDSIERGEKRVHPTQKPTDLHCWVFDKWGKHNDVVVDLFGGSGSTLIACEKTGRHARLMELDPKYCDVIRKRYENFINKEDR